ncbi:molybdopterin cofactor-binding domain-containing protein [Aestuariibius sp. HNIBRBA575]|uniref:xanthine dehydrogenase family protein molybdopterin-binding subunit n=1 Tax=Aestuariibius sp. HNIBRBA575 TaxID=3233343 RepID=UPI0034A30370
MTIETSRRNFLKGASASVAVLAFGATPNGGLASSPVQSSNITPFVKIHADGTVTAIIKHFEGGQGAATGLSTLIAEEMNMELADIQFETAPADINVYSNLFFGFQGTGGSTALANSFMQYRTAGAAAREVMLQAAAIDWGVNASELVLKDGVISGAGKTGSIGEFLSTAAGIEVPAKPTLKAPEEWTQIGNPQKNRLDSSAKINGQAVFGMDIQLDNQMVVAVKRMPKLGSVVSSFDDTASKDVPGFIMAKALPNGKGVVAYAENTWAAFQARDALNVVWDDTNAESRSSADIKEELLAAVNTAPRYQGTEVTLDAANAAIDGAKTVVEREFYFPLLAQAPMEPLSATIAPTEDGGVIMYDGTQNQTGDHQLMHQILGLPMEKIQVKTIYAGGFFGRRFTIDMDYATEVTLAYSMTDGTRPVKLAWSREDDITGGWYRPAFVHKARIGLDEDGKIIGWDHRVAGHAIAKDGLFKDFFVRDDVDHSSIEGTAHSVYAIPEMHVGLTDAGKSTTATYWRSVGHNHNAYVTETMMDVAAAAAGQDPVTFRLAHLNSDSADHQRKAHVLREVAEKAGIGQDLPEGHYHGVAVHKSFGTFCAQVCEISINDRDYVQIEKYTAVVDCGVAVNPDVVKAQVEGGIGYGVGHIMRDEITLEDGAVVQQNFPDYEPLRITDIKAIDVHVVKSNEAPSGIGEPGLPPAGPALGNAIAASGRPAITHLPMIYNGVDFV